MDWKPASLQDKIGVHFKNSDLLFESLIHPSYAQQLNRSENNNERLEYLGEKILELIITNYLYQNCSYLAVSKLTTLRDKLEEGEKLTNLWFRLGLGESFPFLATKDERHRLRIKRNNPFEKALKALVGAIHIDRGLPQTSNWVKKQLIAPLLAHHLKKIQDRSNPKKQLQFLGNALFNAIVADYFYQLFPYVNPSFLSKIAKKLVVKEQQNKYINKLTLEDWKIIDTESEKICEKSFTGLLAAIYLHFDQQNSKTSFRETGSWWVNKCIDEDEIWRELITLLVKDGVPQKWIIRQVMGYESKDYNEGRKRFHELMESSKIDNEIRVGDHD
ncbi:MAG: ribonuclease III domain-containing protein [cyanobacterium endosymbiont of Rhopalodia musculus]|uniref:ribonuclease III domain-containing protein n=1 Tax=cyanobacterium endosymbiont of Epithemia clementina EcSB TaxID=3034674 RepID=UPI0024800215|nr:ribonuclease III domain-containing protein [cyanobacterium endosymbiont of Epithemia clementina EcSB]WGT67211.1 ribonuclease III domain-containing protein [cyanobacterium endosymbiont of Epithemia clementina EcSB]